MCFISLFFMIGCKTFSTQTSEQIPPTPGPKTVEKPMLQTIQLSTKNAPVSITDTNFKLNISESSHKSRAPVGRVCVLVDNGSKKAETCWVTESGVFEKDWKTIGGRRWVSESNAYEEIYITGWQIKLNSIDDTHANASAKTITVSLQQSQE